MVDTCSFYFERSLSQINFLAPCEFEIERVPRTLKKERKKFSQNKVSSVKKFTTI